MDLFLCSARISRRNSVVCACWIDVLRLLFSSVPLLLLFHIHLEPYSFWIFWRMRLHRRSLFNDHYIPLFIRTLIMTIALVSLPLHWEVLYFRMIFIGIGSVRNQFDPFWFFYLRTGFRWDLLFWFREIRSVWILLRSNASSTTWIHTFVNFD